MKAPIWLLILLAALVAANVYTIVGTIDNAGMIASLSLPFAPGMRMAIAAVWILLLSALLIGLVRARQYAFIWAAPLLTLYALVGLAWDGIFVQSSYSRGSQSFDALVTLIGLGSVWWVAIRRGWLKSMFPSPGTD
jgi:hypothetical protein